MNLYLIYTIVYSYLIHVFILNIHNTCLAYCSSFEWSKNTDDVWHYVPLKVSYLAKEFFSSYFIFVYIGTYPVYVSVCFGRYIL